MINTTYQQKNFELSLDKKQSKFLLKQALFQTSYKKIIGEF
jgi:hypothetical protein